MSRRFNILYVMVSQLWPQAETTKSTMLVSPRRKGAVMPRSAVNRSRLAGRQNYSPGEKYLGQILYQRFSEKAGQDRVDLLGWLV